MDFIVLVCGGRDFHDREQAFAALDRLHGEKFISLLIHGGARGADGLGGEWADSRGVLCRVFQADWDRHRQTAGPIRNQRMLDEGKPDFCVAFPGGRGTADMRRRCEVAGVPVWQPATGR